MPDPPRRYVLVEKVFADSDADRAEAPGLAQSAAGGYLGICGATVERNGMREPVVVYDADGNAVGPLSLLTFRAGYIQRVEVFDGVETVYCTLRLGSVPPI